MKVFKAELLFKACSEGDACDYVSVILSERGWAEGCLLDWSYDNCGGEYVGPSDNGDGTYKATVWLLPKSEFEHLLSTWLLLPPHILKVEIVETKDIEVPVATYDEGDFLYELFPEGSTSE
jgi:hypothetical protein